MLKRVLIGIFFLPLPLFANQQFLDGVFIAPVSRFFSMEIEDQGKEFDMAENFRSNILEMISGMVYGWKFRYIPSDIKREISEEFSLELIAQIKQQDPNLLYRDNWVEDYIMYQNMVYRLNDFQQKRLNSWNTTIIPTSTGSGEGSLFIEEGQQLSLHEALKDSIKKEFQSRGKDKPRVIEGQILLRDVPRQFVTSGSFKTNVEVFILYKKIEEYRYQ